MIGRALGWLAVACSLIGCGRDNATRADDIRLLELDAPALAVELAAGRVSAERVTRAVLARIAEIDAAGPSLHAIIEVNPDALAIARELDRRFERAGPIGPLHGMPVALKANIDTADRLATTAGSLALAGHHATRDAEIVRRLRAAGAVIVAKTNLSEWANIRSSRSTSGWSSLGGQTKNPYALDRNPCGSSSGSAVAVAARIVPLAIGTETDGSIVCPAGVNGVVGIKPTGGSVSGEGIIPISSVQDIAGPIARSVAGAAMLLDVIGDTRAGVGLRRDARAVPSDLRGVRLGVWRDYVGAGALAAVEAEFTRALEMLRSAGAELVDPVMLDLPESVGQLELLTLLYDLNDDLTAYLASARTTGGGGDTIPGSLEELVQWNRAHATDVMPYFGQELFEAAIALDESDERGRTSAVAGSRTLVRARLDEVFEAQGIDALIAPVNAPALPIDYARDRGDVVRISTAGAAAMSGYPGIAVPSGLIGGLPVAVELVGRPGTEAQLVEIAAAFERVRGPLAPPGFMPTLNE
jgi:amidase